MEARHPGHPDQKVHGRRGGKTNLDARLGRKIVLLEDGRPKPMSGFTAVPDGHRLNVPRRGNVVSGIKSRLVTPETWAARGEEELADFRHETAELRKANGYGIGGWVDEENRVWLDVVEVIHDEAEANRRSTERGEMGYFNVERQEFVPTGGTGDATDTRAATSTGTAGHRRIPLQRGRRAGDGGLRQGLRGGDQRRVEAPSGELRHLPGEHNQKDHGRDQGGLAVADFGSGEPTQEAWESHPGWKRNEPVWTVEGGRHVQRYTLVDDRGESHTVERFSNTDGFPLRSIVNGYTPISHRGAGAPNPPVGNVTIVDGRYRITSSEAIRPDAGILRDFAPYGVHLRRVHEMAGSVDDLTAPGVHVGDTGGDRVTGYVSYDAPGFIHASRWLDNAAYDQANYEFHLAEGSTIRHSSSAEWTITHEYGHIMHARLIGSDPAAQERRRMSGAITMAYARMTAATKEAARVRGVSEYGRSNEREAFAESFADWVLSGGKPSAPSTKVYADFFGFGSWPKPGPIEQRSTLVDETAARLRRSIRLMEARHGGVVHKGTGTSQLVHGKGGLHVDTKDVVQWQSKKMGTALKGATSKQLFDLWGGDESKLVDLGKEDEQYAAAEKGEALKAAAKKLPLMKESAPVDVPPQKIDVPPQRARLGEVTFPKNLPPGETEAFLAAGRRARKAPTIRTWTSEEPGGYVDIRDDFLNGRPTPRAKALVQEMRKMPKHEGTVYRGITPSAPSESGQPTKISLEEAADAWLGKVGSEIAWKAPASTTIAPHVARGFAGEGGMVFKINGARGANISGNSRSPDEREVLMPPGARLRVDAVSRTDTGHLLVEMTMTGGHL